MRWLFIADVGGKDTFHVGDEAMLAANLARFRDVFPGSDFTVVSKDPAFTARAYGVAAIDGLGFCAAGDRAACDALLAGLSAGPAPAALGFFTGPDTGLVISGGGNLASTWFPQIYERLALARAAVRNGRPVLILGQTIGPELIEPDAALVSELLGSALWIGVREPFSYALARRLGAPADRLSYQTDDASFIDAAALPADVERLLSACANGWIAVTIHAVADPAENGAMIGGIARELEQVGRLTGCDLVFVPHAAAAPDAGARFGDLDLAHALSHRVKEVRFCVLPMLDPWQSRQVYDRAAMTISTRYHPLVFSLAAGRPCVGLHTDHYTDTKLSGALLHYGREDDVCGWDDALQGGLVEICRRIWPQRDAIARALAQNNDHLRVADARRFARLVEAVRSGTAKPDAPDAVLHAMCQVLARPRHLPLLARIRALEAAVRDATRHAASLEDSRSEMERYVADLGDRLATATASLHEATRYAQNLADARNTAERFAESLKLERDRMANQAKSNA